MISGCERRVLVQRLCNEVSEVFIDGTFKFGAKYFLKCTIYMDYAMDIMHLFLVRIIAWKINLPLHVECYSM